MSSSQQNLSTDQQHHLDEASKLTIGVIVSDWNSEITHALLKGCCLTLQQQGISDEGLLVFHVPGSFELPAAARMVDDRHSPDAIICLGCVIEGETKHNEYINLSVAQGLTQLSIVRSKPFVFGVLTPNNQDQARERAGGKHGNKGVEAAHTALKMVALQQQLKDSINSIGFK